MGFIEILEAGRRDFLDATRDISREQASAKPTPNSWSVLECIEHVAAVEDRYLSWISKGSAVAAKRDSEKEMRLFTTIRNRLTKVEAPDLFHPRGRFGTLSEALSEFGAVRDRSGNSTGVRPDGRCVRLAWMTG